MREYIKDHYPTILQYLTGDISTDIQIIIDHLGDYLQLQNSDPTLYKMLRWELEKRVKYELDFNRMKKASFLHNPLPIAPSRDSFETLRIWPILGDKDLQLYRLREYYEWWGDGVRLNQNYTNFFYKHRKYLHYWTQDGANIIHEELNASNNNRLSTTLGGDTLWLVWGNKEECYYINQQFELVNVKWDNENKVGEIVNLGITPGIDEWIDPLNNVIMINKEYILGMYKNSEGIIYKIISQNITTMSSYTISEDVSHYELIDIYDDCNNYQYGYCYGRTKNGDMVRIHISDDMNKPYPPQIIDQSYQPTYPYYNENKQTKTREVNIVQPQTK